ncbi:MAG: hypothetical protein N3E37_01725 [Candidatus Micrarchaeota archaeon]|nr:hypothetical protein [Candidatus Micrarchaeota archaeon]
MSSSHSVELISEKINNFFSVKELVVKIDNVYAPLKRNEIREIVAKHFMIEISQLVLVKAEHKINGHYVICKFRYYLNKDALMKYEKKHLLIRNGLIEKPQKSKS